MNEADLGKMIVSALGAGGVKAWAIGAASGVLGTWMVKKIMARVPEIVGVWFLRAVQRGLSAEGIENGSFQQLVKDMSLALVKFAERELPDKGLGPQRLALIEHALGRLPAVGRLFSWAILVARPEFEQMIEDAVRRMDEIAKEESQRGSKPA